MLVTVITFETPSSRSFSGATVANSGGYVIAPTAMMLPCPAMSRGTEATVPSPPGLVSDIVAPAKSSGISLLVRAFSTTCSYAAWKPAKSIVSAPLMTGTTSPRLPSLRVTSTARPRLIEGGVMR